VNFLNPLLLSGLAAAAIPVLIHLFTRRRPRDVPFSSLEFLTEVNQSEIRRLRLKQWLLLLLRTLAVACLALAFARPALRGGAGGGSAASTVVVLLDVSGSMDALGARGTPLSADARRAAEDLLGTLGPADAMLLVPYDDTPRPVTPAPSSDAGRLRGALQALGTGARATDHRRALEAAAGALAASHALNRELFWISDFQRSGFGGHAFASPPGPWDRVRVALLPLVPRTTANAALADAALAPGADAAALAVTAASFGAAPGDRAVSVEGWPARARSGAATSRWGPPASRRRCCRCRACPGRAAWCAWRPTCSRWTTGAGSPPAAPARCACCCARTPVPPRCAWRSRRAPRRRGSRSRRWTPRGWRRAPRSPTWWW
jgi:hypothetical protein